MRGFFSFFAIFSIVLIALYLAAAGEKNRETYLDSESSLLLVDSIHYEKQNLKSLFWEAAASENRDENLALLEAGLRKRGIAFIGGPSNLVDECPFITEQKCVLITNCKGNYCGPEAAEFKARIEKPFAKTEFLAMQGEYLVLG